MTMDELNSTGLRRSPCQSSPFKPKSSALDVLIVEDDELMRARLESLIESAGYGVIGVASASEAREALSALFFPMIIVDRLLGNEDGITLCSELRKRSADSHVYIMLLTTLDSPTEVAAGFEAGADAYLSKRAGDAELLEQLRSAWKVIKMPTK
jgi:two-component system, OmpR family, phosphate regulon response regulator OmpR